MEPLFNVNGLMFWTEREIRLRRQFEDHFAFTMQQILLETNPAWRMIQVEGPQLTPRANINPNYTNEDVWAQADPQYTTSDGERVEIHVPEEEKEHLVLRPETTPSSYVYACHLLNNHSGTKPPFCIWQSGKSFRREQDQVTKNMRLKEFWQQEFQCIYTADTMNDYHTAVLEPVKKMIREVVGPFPTTLVKSDRLPSYSEITTDVEILDHDCNWMEVCSISRRTDFPQKAKFQVKKKIVEKDLLVLEVAIGLDRCVYNFNQRGE